MAVLTMQLSLFALAAHAFSLDPFEPLYASRPISNDLTPRQSNSNITSLPAQFFPTLDSKRVKITYGPYTAPGADTNDGMQIFTEQQATLPCTNCLITWMQAGLEYPNGSYANADTGLWLHHTVLTNLGRPDAVCTNGYNMTAPGERFFASGNERTPANFAVNGIGKIGYYFAENDTMSMLIELMNEMADSQDAVMTLEFEYIPGRPQGFAEAQTYWMDVGGCTNSEVPGQMNASFTFTSQDYTNNMTGHILGTGGHVHDGGLGVTVWKNGQNVCNMNATYGASSAYIDGPGMDMSGMGGGNMTIDTVHISNMSTCDWPSAINPGDKFSVTAYYDTNEHAPMMDSDGQPMTVMGISILYVTNVTNPLDLAPFGLPSACATCLESTRTVTSTAAGASGTSSMGSMPMATGSSMTMAMGSSSSMSMAMGSSSSGSVPMATSSSGRSSSGKTEEDTNDAGALSAGNMYGTLIAFAGFVAACLV